MLRNLLAIAFLLSMSAAQDAVPANAAEARAILAKMPVHEPVADGVLVRILDGMTQKPVSGADVFTIEVPKDRAMVAKLRERAPDRSAFVCALAAVGGTRYRTGDDGQIRVAGGGRRTILVLAGDRLGIGRTDQKVPIEVYAALAIEVAVRTADGKPACGVPVGIGRPNWGMEDRLQPLCTDRDGHCRIDVDATMGLDVVVSVLGGFSAPCQQPLDLRKPIAAPIELTVPAFGQVRFILYGSDEKPATGLRSANLGLVTGSEVNAANPASRVPLSVQPSTISPDSALFSCVELGREVIVTAEVEGMAKPIEFRGKGPTRAGELVVLDGRLTVGPPILSFRVVDQKGQPVVDELVGLVVRDEHSYRISDTKTDAAGRITLPLEDAKAKGLHVLRRRASAATEYLGAAHREFSQLALGPQDLGDLQLADEPVAARGRLVDADGKPIAGVWLVGSTSITTGSGGGSWSGEHWFFRHRVQTAADGTFELRETASIDGALPLSLEGGDWVVPGALQVTIGNGGVEESRAYRTSTIAARFAGDDLAGFSCEVRLVHRESGQEMGAEFLDGVLAPVRWAVGTYDLHIGRNPEFTIEGIKAPAGGEADDPRLAAIVVPDDLCLVRVIVVDEKDQPIPSATLMRYQVQGAGRSGSGSFSDANGRCVVLLSKKDGELGVSARGFEEQTFREFTPTMRVQLAPAAMLAVKFVGLPELPPDCRFQIEWQAPQAPRGWVQHSNLEDGAASFQATKRGTWRAVLKMVYQWRGAQGRDEQLRIVRALGGPVVTLELEAKVEASEPKTVTLTKEQQDDLAERIKALKDIFAEGKDK